MADGPPCLLDVISDPDALNLFLNDTDDEQDLGKGGELFDFGDEDVTSAIFPDDPIISNGDPAPSQVPLPSPASATAQSAMGAPFLSPPRTGKVMPSAVPQAPRANSIAASPSSRGMPATPGSMVGSPFSHRQSPVPSPASVQISQSPSPMPSPASTPTHHNRQQQIQLLNSAGQTQIQNVSLPQAVQTQFVVQGQPQSYQMSGASPLMPVQQQLTTMAASSLALGPQVVSSGGALRAPLQLPPGALIQPGNKIIVQGQNQLLQQQIANSPQPPAQQLMAPGSVPSIATTPLQGNQPPSLQAPPNINIMNLQPRPQQLVIQQNVPGTNNKQNVVLTALPNNNVVRVAGQPGAVQVLNQNPVVLTKGNPAVGQVILQQQPASQIQLAAGVKPDGLQQGTVAQLNSQGQIVNVQQPQNPGQMAVLQNQMNVLGSQAITATQQPPKPPQQQQQVTGTHIISINGRAIAVSTQQLQQLIALQQQKGAANGQGVQILQNAAVSQTVTTCTAPVTTVVSKPIETNTQQARDTQAAVQQHLQEIHEKFQKKQQQSTHIPQQKLPTSQPLQSVSSQAINSGQPVQTLTKPVNLDGSNQFGNVTLVTATGQPVPQAKPVGFIGGQMQVLQQNQQGLVQIQKPGTVLPNANKNLLIQTIMPGNNPKQQVTQFRQILPSTSLVTSSSVMSIPMTTCITTSAGNSSLTLAKSGAAPNVNVKTMGLSSPHLPQVASAANQPQPPGSLASSLAHLLPGFSSGANTLSSTSKVISSSSFPQNSQSNIAFSSSTNVIQSTPSYAFNKMSVPVANTAAVPTQLGAQVVPSSFGGPTNIQVPHPQPTPLVSGQQLVQGVNPQLNHLPKPPVQLMSVGGNLQNVQQNISSAAQQEQNLMVLQNDSQKSLSVQAQQNLGGAVQSGINVQSQLAQPGVGTVQGNRGLVTQQTLALMKSQHAGLQTGQPTQMVPGQMTQLPGQILTQQGQLATQMGQIRPQQGNIVAQQGPIAVQPGTLTTQTGQLPPQPAQVGQLTQPIIAPSGQILPQQHLQSQAGQLISQTGQVAGQPNQMANQQVVTQQVAIPQPGQPGASRIVTIQLTPQVQQAFIAVQHKIKILLAVKNRTDAQNDTLRQLADMQNKIVNFGRNEALKAQQLQQQQQQQQLQQQQQQHQQHQQHLPVPTGPPNAVATQSGPIRPMQSAGPSLQSGVMPGPMPAIVQPAVPVQVQPLVTTAATFNSGVTTTFVNSTVVSSATTSAADSAAEAAITQGTQVITDINQLPPQMRDKLNLQLEKLNQAQLDYFYKNQATILAKLVKQHQETVAMQKQQQLLQQQQQQQMQQQGSGLGTVKVETESKTTTIQPAMGSGGTLVKSSDTNAGVGVKLVQPVVMSSGPSATTTSPPKAAKPPIKLSRKQFFQHYVAKDQKRVEEPDCTTPFQNRKDILKRLLAYHICQVKSDKQEEIYYGDSAYGETSKELLEKKETMFKKYQSLILDDSMKTERTAEIVMVQRLFLASERENFSQERKQAEEDPENFQPIEMFSDSSDDDEDVSDRPSFTSPAQPHHDPVFMSPITSPEADAGKKSATHSSETSDNPSSPGNNYTLQSTKGLKLVFKSSPLHHAGSPAHVTESYSVKSEDSGISSQQNSVETPDDGPPARKRVCYTAEDREHYRTKHDTVRTISAPPTSKLPFDSYRGEKRDLGKPPDDWMLPESPKAVRNPTNVESRSAVAELLSTSGDLGAYSDNLLGDFTFSEDLGQNLGDDVFEDKFLPQQSRKKEMKHASASKGAQQYEYISEVSDYDTDNNLEAKADRDAELDGALGGLLSDMEQDGKDYPTEMSFNQGDQYSSDQTSQSEGEDTFEVTMSGSVAGNGTNETQSAIDSLLALESPQDFDYDALNM